MGWKQTTIEGRNVHVAVLRAVQKGLSDKEYKNGTRLSHVNDIMHSAALNFSIFYHTSMKRRRPLVIDDTTSRSSIPFD